MRFDTAASNTTRISEADILLEKSLERSLLLLVCRRCMLQVMLSDTFNVCFGPSSCPEVLLFKLFRHKMEQKLNHHEPRPRATTLISTSGDLMSPIHNQLSKGHSHEDCKVLWHAEAGMHIRMNSKCNIRTPGDIHRTHWVAKTIYTLKMERLLEGNEALMQVTACEQQPLQPFNRFVAHVYNWNRRKL